MTKRVKNSLVLAIGAFVLGVAIALLFRREPMEPLTRDALESARRRWGEAAQRNYDLRLQMHGSAYDVTVRDGVVIRLLSDGKPANTAEPGAYSVDGLFEILAMELENVADPYGPFAAQQRTMVMRVRFHPTVGYLERYLRSSGGVGRGTAIEMIEFVPRP